jgi:uncharacterized membrane protein YqjE
MNESFVREARSDYQGGARSNGRNLASIVSEIRDEVKSFIHTRVRIIRADLHEAIAAIKLAVPLALISLVLFGIASLLFTAAAVVLVASAFAGNPYAWFFALIIIGVVWIVLGAIAAFFAVSQFKGKFPKRTLEVLKADKIWLQAEARSHS